MDVFLFPLINVTLFPRTTKPLNIFEPRYLEMVRKSAETGTPIALGFIEDASLVGPVTPGQTVPYVRPLAGFGLTQIIEERTNGTLMVFVQGQGKCRLGKVKASDAPYMICEAELVEDDLAIDPSLQAQVQGLNKILARWITTHIPDQDQRDVFLKNLTGPEEIIGAFASYLVRDYDLQQMVLEFDSLNEKIRFLHRLAESNEVTI
jgi:ATP-dependent Lon protease